MDSSGWTYTLFYTKSVLSVQKLIIIDYIYWT